MSHDMHPAASQLTNPYTGCHKGFEGYAIGLFLTLVFVCQLHGGSDITHLTSDADYHELIK